MSKPPPSPLPSFSDSTASTTSAPAPAPLPTAEAIEVLLSPDGYYKYLGIPRPEPDVLGPRLADAAVGGDVGGSGGGGAVDLDLVKRNYRRLSLRHHPDRRTGDAETFRALNRAKVVLSNPKLRREYDLVGLDLDDPDDDADHHHHRHQGSADDGSGKDDAGGENDKSGGEARRADDGAGGGDGGGGKTETVMGHLASATLAAVLQVVVRTGLMGAVSVLISRYIVLVSARFSPLRSAGCVFVECFLRIFMFHPTLCHNLPIASVECVSQQPVECTRRTLSPATIFGHWNAPACRKITTTTECKLKTLPAIGGLSFISYKLYSTLRATMGKNKLTLSMLKDALSPLTIAFGIYCMHRGRRFVVAAAAAAAVASSSSTGIIADNSIAGDGIAVVVEATTAATTYLDWTWTFWFGEALVMSLFISNSIERHSKSLVLAFVVLSLLFTLWLRGRFWRYASILLVEAVIAMVCVLIFPIMEMILESIVEEKMRKVGEKIRAHDRRMRELLTKKKKEQGGSS